MKRRWRWMTLRGEGILRPYIKPSREGRFQSLHKSTNQRTPSDPGHGAHHLCFPGAELRSKVRSVPTEVADGLASKDQSGAATILLSSVPLSQLQCTTRGLLDTHSNKLNPAICLIIIAIRSFQASNRKCHPSLATQTRRRSNGLCRKLRTRSKPLPSLDFTLPTRTDQDGHTQVCRELRYCRTTPSEILSGLSWWMYRYGQIRRSDSNARMLML